MIFSKQQYDLISTEKSKDMESTFAPHMPHLLFKTCRSFPKSLSTSDMVEILMNRLFQIIDSILTQTGEPGDVQKGFGRKANVFQAQGNK